MVGKQIKNVIDCCYPNSDQKSMDTIQLNVSSISPIPETALKQYNVIVSLNDIALEQHLFNGPEVISASDFALAEFDLFTCSCGVPECAGFQTPVSQEKNSHFVQWTFPDDNSYGVQKLIYKFDPLLFAKAFSDLKIEMLELEKNDIILSVCFNDNHIEDKPPISLQSHLDWHNQRFGRVQEFKFMLKNNFPGLFGKSFNLKYQGGISQYAMDFFYLVCRSLNEWPNQQDEVSYQNYLSDGLKAGKAIEKAIGSGDYASLLDIIHQNYQEFSEEPLMANSVYHAFEFDLHQIVKEEEFDIQKFEIVVK